MQGEKRARVMEGAAAWAQRACPHGAAARRSDGHLAARHPEPADRHERHGRNQLGVRLELCPPVQLRVAPSSSARVTVRQPGTERSGRVPSEGAANTRPTAELGCRPAPERRRLCGGRRMQARRGVGGYRHSGDARRRRRGRLWVGEELHHPLGAALREARQHARLHEAT